MRLKPILHHTRHQTGVTPIVQTQKKFSKAIAIKKPSVLGSKEKTKANTTEKEDVEKETTSQSNNTQFPLPPPLSSSGGGSTNNNNSIKIGSVFQKGGRVPTKTTSESLEAKRASEATKTKDNNNNNNNNASSSSSLFFCECQGRRAGRVADAGETTTTATVTKGEGFESRRGERRR